MQKFGLLGYPLSHSYSPLIHKEIFKEMNIPNATYSLFEVSSEELPKMIEKLKNKEYQGFNVTIPYKKEIMSYLDEIDEHALKIGSVNTVVYKDGKAIGYNTDYYGFYNELLYFNVDIKDKDCYILGTGGASLAIYKVLEDMGGNILYVSRNPKNDKTMSYEELENKNIDVLVNTTPVGMYPNVSDSPISIDIAKKCKNVIDIIFNPRITKLLEYANSNMDGLFMLVGQAIKAEELWHNKEYKGSIKDLLLKIERMI